MTIKNNTTNSNNLDPEVFLVLLLGFVIGTIFFYDTTVYKIKPTPQNYRRLVFVDDEGKCYKYTKKKC
jgi:hypothetical protein